MHMRVFSLRMLNNNELNVKPGVLICSGDKSTYLSRKCQGHIKKLTLRSPEDVCHARSKMSNKPQSHMETFELTLS